MQRWVSKYVLFLFVIVLILIVGNAEARGEITLIGSDEEIVDFPNYVKNISPKLAENSVSRKDLSKYIMQKDMDAKAREESAFLRLQKKLEVNYPSSVLEELKNACEVLPQAARNLHGNQVNVDGINGKTIFVNKEVTRVLKENRLIPGRNPRDMAMLFQLCDAAVEYNICPLRNAYAFEIAKRIQRSTFDLVAHMKKNRFFKKMSDEDIIHQAVEQALLSEQDKFLQRQEEFVGVDSKKSQQWVEKYVSLLLAGVKAEFTIADYIGLNGQDNWRDGRIKLSNSGLTSFEGLELVSKPNVIQEIDLSGNNIQIPKLTKTRKKSNGETVVVDIGSRGVTFAFSRLTNLKHVNLSSNNLHKLPDRIFIKNPLESLHLEDNQLRELPEILVGGLTRVTALSIKNNPIPAGEVEGIVQLLPQRVVEFNQCVESE